MNQRFAGRGPGMGGRGGGKNRTIENDGFNAGKGHGNRGRGYGKNRNSNIMDFSNTDDLSQLIHGCSHYLKQSEMSDLGGTQHKILSILNEKGNMPQRSLMELLHIKAGSLSEIIKKLEVKGFIEKLPNPDDRRSMLISITEAGKGQLSSCDGKCGCAFDVLDEEKQNELRGILKELLGAWY